MRRERRRWERTPACRSVHHRNVALCVSPIPCCPSIKGSQEQWGSTFSSAQGPGPGAHVPGLGCSVCFYVGGLFVEETYVLSPHTGPEHQHALSVNCTLSWSNPGLQSTVPPNLAVTGDCLSGCGHGVDFSFCPRERSNLFSRNGIQCFLFSTVKNSVICLTLSSLLFFFTVTVLRKS